LARHTFDQRETVVELIASTTTKTGLTVRCELNTRNYPKGLKVEDAEMATLDIKGDAFQPEWNYTVFLFVTAQVAAGPDR